MHKIDAVEMKNEIQRRIAEANAGKSDDQIREERDQYLQKSDRPLAKMWRRLRESKRIQPKRPGE